MAVFDNQIKVIGFDADDTLWVNEPYYLETETAFCEILKDHGEPSDISKELLNTEIRNVPMYGYGTKGFILSLVETAITVSGGKVSANTISEIIQLGKIQFSRPVELLPGVEVTLKTLSEAGHNLILATKGDLYDQERKLAESNLEPYFHHIEIMSHKTPEYYEKLLAHLDLEPSAFLMIGNSLKSDILPVLEVGGSAIHIPYHTTWALEQVDPPEREGYDTITKLEDLLEYFS